ncbi:hypothetical protein LVJ94_23450 [Pendulispora rubella]|uniref:Lipoprotein n=1 Tax=Pendulispora rubella TaxID=2741070 RepID=A0ABZ2LLY3_9BACT
MHSKWAWSGALIAGVVLSACGSSGGDENGGTKDTAEGAWGCEAKGGSRVVCTSAQTLGGSTANTLDQYACAAGEKSARCPDEASLKGSGSLSAVIDTDIKAAAFDKLQWACLTTGKHQVQCARDLSLMAEVGGSVDIEGQLSLPKSCSVQDWEPYFAQLASKVYKSVGFDIDFPRELFNSHATLESLIEAAAKDAMTPGKPSCYVAEWDLRAQAWLLAVGRGCVNLTAPILVWCQQAANYAPETRECNPSGSWAQ